MKCSIDNESLKQIKNMTAKLARNHLREKNGIDVFKSEFKEFLKNISDQFELTNSLEVAQTIGATLSRYGITAESVNYFTEDNINNLLVEADKNILVTDSLENSTDRITDYEQVRVTENSTGEFMKNAFARATEVKFQFEQNANLQLFDAIFINRNSNKWQKGIVKTNKDLNDNIRAYQTTLLSNIVRYLRKELRNAPNLHLDDTVKKALLNPNMYNLDNKYTGILETLLPLINTYIKLPLVGNTDILHELYYSSKNSSDTNSSINSLRLKAFNSLLLLENFDSYLRYKLGNLVIINDFGFKTGEDKYSIARTTGNLATTWSTNENIKVEDELDNVTKLAINTTPLYNWQSDTPKDGQFLNFLAFLHIVGKIKSLVLNPELNKVIIDLDFRLKYPQLYREIPEEARGKSLSFLIASIRRNPVKYTHVIFDIFSNETIRQSFPSIYTNFTKDELNKLYSISKGIFNGKESLRLLAFLKSDLNYYLYITQTVDSIFNTLFLQYYNDNGEIKVRSLIDQSVNNIKRKVELTININNSIKLIKSWKNHVSHYKLKQINDGDGVPNYIVFTVPGVDIPVKVYLSSGRIEIAKAIDFNNDFFKYLPFFDDVLGLNLQNNIDLVNSLEEVFSSKYDMGEKLLNFSARVLANLYISKEIISELHGRGVNQMLKYIYGDNAPAFNFTLNELGLVQNKDVDTLNKIALAQANLNGITTATLVKDGEGNGLSKQTLSRLLGSFPSQWELLEKAEDSATNSFLLLTNPEILTGVYNLKEFNDPNNKNKSATKMSTKEMAYSQIVYDFIGGLMDAPPGSIVGNNNILILPSVNSDKPNIGRLGTNLNAEVFLREKRIKLSLMSNNLLRDLAAQEFGDFYEKMILSCEKKFRLLEEFAEQEGYNIKGLLSEEYTTGFKVFNEHFHDLNTGYNSPVEFISALTLKYNQKHRLHPIELVDQVHFKSLKNGNIDVSSTIINQLIRFKPDSEVLTNYYYNNPGAFENRYKQAEKFWDYLHRAIVTSLLKEGFNINVHDSNSKELNFIREHWPEWIDLAGNLILARDGYADYAPIRSVKDAEESGALILNPILERYNLFDYIISQEYQNLTVGSFVGHPDKSGSDAIIELEASLFAALAKRNVSHTAAMHEFQINTLDGIPELYNVAVIEDIKDKQGLILGLTSDIKPFDGATFVNPFNVILENNSLEGQKAGITKKQFVHFKHLETGTGGIIKTAGFGLTNDWIRNSPFLQTMMRKMTDHVWLTEDGKEYFTDITKDYNGNKINYEKFFFKVNNKYYQITNIESNGNNTYKRTILEVTADGNPVANSTITEEFVVNSNYKLWQFFGGDQSMELKNKMLQYSNTSVENVVTAMNNIGIIKNPNHIETLDDLYLPLKNSDIHYVATAGAVKQGAANINSKEVYSDNELAYNFLRIRMYLAGILLDKEHHADDSELSLMTQVVSACAAKGYTFDLALGLYGALKRSTDIKEGDFLQSVRELFKTNTPEAKLAFRELLMKIIVKLIATSNGDNFAKNISLELIELAKLGKDVKFSEALLPLSDNLVYRQVLSAISSYLTTSGIKLKIPGILSVLTPSYNIFKLYDGKKYESYTNPKLELEEILKKKKPIFDQSDVTTSITNLELGRYYLIKYNITSDKVNPDGTISKVIELVEDPEPKLIKTPNEYRELKKQIAEGKIASITEDVRQGRDLAGYNVRFDTDKGSYLLWDLTSASTLFELNELSEKWTNSDKDIESLKDIISRNYNFTPNITAETAKIYLESFGKRVRRQLQYDLLNLSPSLENVLDLYNKLLATKTDSKEWYERYAMWVNLKLHRPHKEVLHLNGKTIIPNKLNFEEVNNNVLKLLEKTQQVLIDGAWHKIDKNSLKEQAYELILPKTFASKFGLSEFDDLNTIVNDPDYFIKLYKKNLATKVGLNLFTIEFKRSNGKHIYLLTKENLNTSGLTKAQGIITSTDPDGSVYRMDSNNNRLYGITSDTEIYYDFAGNEVIVSNDIDHYINELSYESINLSSNLLRKPKQLLKIRDALNNSSNKTANDVGEYLSLSDVPLFIMQYNNRLNDVNNLDENSFIVKQNREKYTSFMRSLDTIASRTPAQSMQSYMPMKIVAFDNPNINTAYVSTYQILLQGSDYDIDAVSIATLDIANNGLLELWSPYANLNNLIMCKKSEELPMPTGEKLELIELQPNATNYASCVNPFIKYRNIFNINYKYTQNDKGKWIKSNSEMTVRLKLKTPELMELLKNFLSEYLALITPSNNNVPLVIAYLKENGINIENKEQLQSLYDNLKRIIDKHNLYLDKVSPNKLSRIINNRIFIGMYNSIIDPVNLVLAQSPIDYVTKPLKEIAETSSTAKEANGRAPGNFVNKYQSIEDNQVGKESVGINAVGLKTFFGLTQYVNTILNEGTEELLRHLLFYKKIGGKEYRTLANVRAKDPASIKNIEVLRALSSVLTDKDAALTLSALLSLSVDNAKELDLSKLNATTKTMGLYIYGVTIGMDVHDIAEILMSDTGRLYSEIMKENVFSGERGYSDIVKATTYFDKGGAINKILNKYNVQFDLNGNKINNPRDILLYKLMQKRFLKSTKYDDFYDLIAETPIELLKNEFNALYNELTDKNSYSTMRLARLMLDIIQYKERRDKLDPTVWEDIKSLASGALELRVLGQIYSLNLGVKTNLEDYLRLVNNIETAIYDKTGENLIDLEKFAFDAEYRNKMIEEYDKVKDTFNILEAAVTSPQYLGYILTLALSLKAKNESFKFRSSRALARDLAGPSSILDLKMAKGTETFIGDYLRNKFLLSGNTQIIIPKGNKIFDRYGKSSTATLDTPVKLGTDEGNASFKLFMEKQVIPDLKAGRIRPELEFAGVSNNGFIKNLTFDLNTHTISGNADIVSTLPINMLPRTELDTILLNKYRGEFNKLSRYSYLYNLTSYTSDGKLQTSLSNPIPLVDLFTYYTMIAHNWKLSENSLLPILDSFMNEGIIKDFHKYEQAMDLSGETLSMENVTEEMILPYVIDRGSGYNSYAEHLWVKDKSTGKYQYGTKTSFETKLMYAELAEQGLYDLIPLNLNYTITPNTADDSYFQSPFPRDFESGIFKGAIEDELGHRTPYDLQYNSTTGEITKFTYMDNVSLYTEKDLQTKKVPMKKIDGIQILDKELLQALIESEINPC